MAYSDIHSNFKKVIKALVENGLTITGISSTNNLLRKYLANINPGIYIPAVMKPGWHCINGQYFYALLGRVFPDNQFAPIYIDEAKYPATEFKATYGLEEWKNKIGNLCNNNPQLQFVISAVLSSFWLHHLDMDGIIFHLVGPSSRGKSTHAHVAASVLLGALERYFKLWNATNNELERECPLYNDATVIFDEICQISPRDLDKAIYSFHNGQSKKTLPRSFSGIMAWHHHLHRRKDQ